MSKPGIALFKPDLRSPIPSDSSMQPILPSERTVPHTETPVASFSKILVRIPRVGQPSAQDSGAESTQYYRIDETAQRETPASHLAGRFAPPANSQHSPGSPAASSTPHSAYQVDAGPAIAPAAAPSQASSEPVTPQIQERSDAEEVILIPVDDAAPAQTIPDEADWNESATGTALWLHRAMSYVTAKLNRDTVQRIFSLQTAAQVMPLVVVTLVLISAGTLSYLLLHKNPAAPTGNQSAQSDDTHSHASQESASKLTSMPPGDGESLVLRNRPTAKGPAGSTAHYGNDASHDSSSPSHQSEAQAAGGHDQTPGSQMAGDLAEGQVDDPSEPSARYSAPSTARNDRAPQAGLSPDRSAASESLAQQEAADVRPLEPHRELGFGQSEYPVTSAPMLSIQAAPPAAYAEVSPAFESPGDLSGIVPPAGQSAVGGEAGSATSQASAQPNIVYPTTRHPIPRMVAEHLRIRSLSQPGTPSRQAPSVARLPGRVESAPTPR